MPDLDSASAATQLGHIIGDIGGRWMLHDETLGPCRDVGYKNGFVYYIVGRGGVLGDCDADVVTAAFAFFVPSLVRKMWEGGIDVEGPRVAARRYGEACAVFGRKRLSDVAGLERFCELAERVVDSVEVTGLALFAGWRAELRPQDPAGRAYFMCNLLREWRGSAHIVAVAVSGLTAQQAVLASAGGAANAKLFGWPDSTDDLAHLAGRRKEAERLTNQQCATVLEAALSSQERDELVRLAATIKAELDR